MCWPVAGLNCKQMSVRDCAHVCVSARQVTVRARATASQKVIAARRVAHAEPSGHGAAVQRAPCVCSGFYTPA